MTGSAVHEYDAKLERVIDGDTIIVTLDLGFDIRISPFQIRLPRINAPEMSQKPAGPDARQAMTDFLSQGTFTVSPYSRMRDKYGRYLCEVMRRIEVRQPDGSVQHATDNASDHMVASGNAVYLRGATVMQRGSGAVVPRSQAVQFKH